MRIDTGGINNVVIGSYAMQFGVSGDGNIAIGTDALNRGSISNEIAIGDSSLYLSQGSSGGNEAIGYRAMYAATTASYNTTLGEETMRATTIGNNNTGMGYHALLTNTTGSNNTVLGCAAYPIGAGGPTLTNYTGIGYGVGSATSATNMVELGNTSVTAIRAQVTGITAYSDGRIKDNVKANVPGLDFINLLRPVTYNINLHRENEFVYGNEKVLNDWEGKYDIEKITQSGFIAQEVEVAANSVGYNFSGLAKPKNEGELYGVRYTDFIMPLVKSVQELSKQNVELMKRLEEQQKTIDLLLQKYTDKVK